MELVKVEESNAIVSYQEALNRISKGLEVLSQTKKEIKKKLKRGIHYDKPYKGAKQDILTKAGADQLAYLTGIEVVERKDEEIRDRNGNIVGFKVTLRLRSKLLHKEVISSRIASKDEQKARNWSLDMLLAMAFKRAWVYGVIQLTGFSDVFIDEQKEEIGDKPATDKQIALIKTLLREKGYTEEEIEKYLENLKNPTSSEASRIIEHIKAKGVPPSTP